MGIFTPNFKVNPRTILYVITGWLIVIFGLWTAFKPTVLPSPLDVITALPGLWSDGLGAELFSSLWVNVEALIISAAIGLPLSYLARVHLFAPACALCAKMRFLSPAVFFLPLMFLLQGGHEVKVALLVLSELFFLVTTMMGVVINIPEYRFDDARTLRMSEWLSVWYVVIRGTVAQALDAIRDNAAMGWSMLMFVEGTVRSEGGVGVMLINQQKHVNFAEVYAIALTVIIVGISQDWFIGQVKKAVCPYGD